jgi:conjugative relaxase-like TrwC/TraI family protein
VLRITAIGPGAVDYLLRGSDCATHEHAGQVVENGAGRVGHAVGYLLSAAEREPAGVWFGEGLPMLGIEPGTAATEAQVRAVFGRLEHPTRADRDGKPLALGSPPRSFRPFEERLAEALAREPDAAGERRREITAGLSTKARTATAYFDFTFSPVKSVSVYWAALLVAGRAVEASNVVAAHHTAVAAAMAYAEREAAIVRSGYHGKTASGQSVGEYQQARGLVWARWDHSTSRAREPQLHSHVSVLNRAETVSDGVIRALASRGFEPIKQAVDAIYTQTLETTLTASNPVAFAIRPDGRAREILGFAPELLAKASSRNVDVSARQDELVRGFEQAHGRGPSPRDRKQMHDAAWRETRQAKTHMAPRRQLFAWATPLRGELTGALTAAAAWAERVARTGHPDHVGYAGRGREEVLRAAVQVAQAQYATWTVGNLAMAIAAEQTRTPSVTGTPDELAVEVLDHPRRYGLVQVSARDVGPVPQAVQGPGGVSKYRLKNAVYYTTTDQLQIETAIVERGRRTGAPALAEAAVELARAALRATRLSEEQREKVLTVVSSGRGGDVLIGPAGAGAWGWAGSSRNTSWQPSPEPR